MPRILRGFYCRSARKSVDAYAESKKRARSFAVDVPLSTHDQLPNNLQHIPSRCMSSFSTSPSSRSKAENVTDRKLERIHEGGIF